MLNCELPAEFDADFYRSHYADLRQFSEPQLRAHWGAHGILEGRMASAGALRENFVKLALADTPILEIGPF